MKHLQSLTLLVCVGGFSPCFADDPPATVGTQPAPAAAQPAALAPAPVAADPTVVSTVAQPTAVAASSLATTTPANAAGDEAAAKAAAAAAAEEKKYRSRGYRPHVRNGETYWCKSDMPVGSRLPTTTCSTAAEMAENERQSQDTVTQMQMKGQMSPNGH